MVLLFPTFLEEVESPPLVTLPTACSLIELPLVLRAELRVEELTGLATLLLELLVLLTDSDDPLREGVDVLVEEELLTDDVPEDVRAEVELVDLWLDAAVVLSWSLRVAEEVLEEELVVLWLLTAGEVDLEEVEVLVLL